MSMLTRLNKLEQSLGDQNPKQIVTRERFDAVVARVLRASYLGQNCGLPEITEREAKVWAKSHIEQGVSFGGFGFDVDNVLNREE